MKRSLRPAIPVLFFFAAQVATAQPSPSIQWQHLSTKNKDLALPNQGTEETSVVVCDIDQDGLNDFVISERTIGPSVVWYRRTNNGWNRYVIDTSHLHIEAGSDYFDIDGDGDPDIVMGGDFASNAIWWWENPYPNFDPNTAWKRHTIKHSGETKHHDQIFGDFYGDGKTELAFWNQGSHSLNIAEIPQNPREVSEWTFYPIYTYHDDSQMEQRGVYPSWKAINESEGLVKSDIDGDGIPDIVGGGRWFKYLGNHTFSENIIDASFPFSRSAAGQLIKGGRPEVVLVPGDGTAPMVMYEWKKGTWVPKILIDHVTCGHSLKLADIDGDGNLDIFDPEQRVNGENPDSKLRILYGDGKGNFRESIVATGMDLHESKIVDLDGDGDLDILGKPYNYQTPGLDIWLQNGTGKRLAFISELLKNKTGLELYSLRAEFARNIPSAMATVKSMGINEVEVSGFYGLSPAAFKKELDKAKLKATSLILPIDLFRDSINEVIKLCRLFGVKNAGVGWIPHGKSFTHEDAVNASALFNKAGSQLNAAGLHFFYHPHGYEFQYTPDGTLFDLMAASTTPGIVYFQLDVFWVTRGGEDAVSLLNKYPGRFISMHLKDIAIGTAVRDSTGSAPDTSSVVLGKGQVNWEPVLRAALKSGIQQYFIEEENPDALHQIPESLKYLSQLK